MRKALSKLGISLFMASVLCILAGLFPGPVKAEAATKKAKVVLEFSDGTKKTWKTGDSKIKLGKKKLAYVYFGEYPQTVVEGTKLTDAIKNAKYNQKGIATVKGVKYKRLEREEATYVFDSSERGFSSDHYFDWAGKDYAYFKLEPIKWRVLSVGKGIVFLLSEYGLDDQRYNSAWVDTTWADCTLRNWLNSDFLTSAFNAKERKLIKTTGVKNNNNLKYGTEGGEDTKNKVFLLSLDDIVNIKYGFRPDMLSVGINRRCAPTDFANAMGGLPVYDESYRNSEFCKTSEGKWAGWWWLRSPGENSGNAAYVSSDGTVKDSGELVLHGLYTVRPALRLNLSSIIG